MESIREKYLACNNLKNGNDPNDPTRPKYDCIVEVCKSTKDIITPEQQIKFMSECCGYGGSATILVLGEVYNKK